MRSAGTPPSRLSDPVQQAAGICTRQQGSGKGSARLPQLPSEEPQTPCFPINRHPPAIICNSIRCFSLNFSLCPATKNLSSGRTGAYPIGSWVSSTNSPGIFMSESGLFTIGDVLFCGGQDPDHHAIESPGFPPVTYQDLRAEVSALVTSLNARGFHRNDRIALIMSPGPETAVLLVSVMSGFTAIPLNPRSTVEEYRKSFIRIGIQAVIVRKDSLESVAVAAAAGPLPVIHWVPVPRKAGILSLFPQKDPGPGPAVYAKDSDPVYILQTSGTTAVAKIVPGNPAPAVLQQRNDPPAAADYE